MDKIHKLWNLEGFITPMDVGLGFYNIKFESKSDYFRAYTGGPWIIQDHYLTVRKWYGDFKADKAQASRQQSGLDYPCYQLNITRKILYSRLQRNWESLLKWIRK